MGRARFSDRLRRYLNSVAEWLTSDALAEHEDSQRKQQNPGWSQVQDGCWHHGAYLIRRGVSGGVIASVGGHPIGGVHESLGVAMAYCEGHAAALVRQHRANGEAMKQSARAMCGPEDDQ